jgi:hypothetical protein
MANFLADFKTYTFCFPSELSRGGGGGGWGGGGGKRRGEGDAGEVFPPIGLTFHSLSTYIQYLCIMYCL